MGEAGRGHPPNRISAAREWGAAANPPERQTPPLALSYTRVGSGSPVRLGSRRVRGACVARMPDGRGVQREGGGAGGMVGNNVTFFNPGVINALIKCHSFCFPFYCVSLPRLRLICAQAPAKVPRAVSTGWLHGPRVLSQQPSDTAPPPAGTAHPDFSGRGTSKE